MANDKTHLHFQTRKKRRWHLFRPTPTPRGTRQNGTARNGPRSARPERNGTADPAYWSWNHRESPNHCIANSISSWILPILGILLKQSRADQFRWGSVKGFPKVEGLGGTWSMLQSCVQRCSTCFDSYQALRWAKSAVIFLLNHPCVTMGIADIAVLVNTSTYFLPTSCFFCF